MTAREELINDLIAFADLLKRYPDMPVNPSSDATIYVHVPTADENGAAEVHRMAAVLGLDVIESPGHARAELDAGRVRYIVCHNSARAMAEWEATQSYRGAVEPDMAVAR